MERRKKFIRFIFTLLITTSATLTYANTEFPIYLVSASGQGESIGTITAEDSTCGVLLTPHLHSLPAGIHGFHVHVNPSCADKGMAAGDHYDPNKTHAHQGPYSHSGHVGDLPVLIVDAKGNATLPTLAPQFKLKDLIGHAFMIHEGSDNYADQPDKNGGGGTRIACGVIS
jgi:Cu-Zn family superoxide dismutase